MPARRVATALLAVVASGATGAACRSSDSPSKTPPPAAATAPQSDAQAAGRLPDLPADPYAEERRLLVENEIARSTSGDPVRDPRVLTAMLLTPRHEFVPPAMRSQAYADRALPIGFGLTISQPYIVGVMSEAARIKPGDKVLEIGTGSGYQAAVLAMMGAKVYTIELHEELASRTEKVLKATGFGTVQMKLGDGWYGWPDAAPFDAIIVTCATPVIPDRLLAQLKVGGRMVAPIGDVDQKLEWIEKQPDGGIARLELMGVRFGPMRGVVEAER
jgi:protein-L-isoaspartate(D-aspartate) O-methyltransferase